MKLFESKIIAYEIFQGYPKNSPSGHITSYLIDIFEAYLEDIQMG